ncbi:LysR family transcriptional regulator [Fictibacillus sp. FJAT-27399]|uniref:LysR family transcriptional regulator n=1 Tax=Fictibacillus sp. FJAT-27399 TaxID=1729689 RepID=UPI00078319D6|nr:LysR family transcriptional regulator [Fictibacillus sp. FJAT-27399]
MEIRHLEYFSEVAKQLSFTKAASVLHVSQPSISKAIKNLEEELGVHLFDRTKNLELTDAGKAVLYNAQKVLETFYNLTSELNDVMDLKKGEIKIGIPPIIGAAFFSKLVSQYIEFYPLIKITLNEVGSKKIKNEVEDGSLDIGLICNLPINKGNLEIIKVITDPLMLIVNRENPLAKQKIIDLSNLENEPFILYRQDFTLYDRILEECTKKGFSPNVVCQSSQMDFMIEMVDSKLGVALLPSKIAKAINNPNITALKVSNSNINLELGMVWKKNKYLSTALREFISLSKQFADNLTND